MYLTLNLSVILAVLSIIGTVVTAITFFNKVKWDTQKHTRDIDKLNTDMRALSVKLSEVKDTQRAEQLQLIAKIDGVDKSTVKISTTLEHMQKAIDEIKEKMSL